MRLHEHRRTDCVATVDVGQELAEQVAVARQVPEVVVRVDDRQIRLQRLLGVQGKPLRPHRKPRQAGRLRLGHVRTRERGRLAGAHES
jgi:hypothetical protein